MPKDSYLQRYSLIIKRLEKGPATFEQIQDYLQSESGSIGNDFTISLRTFQRDINDIKKQLNFEIANEKKGDKRYYIQSRPETKEQSQRLLEAYEMLSVVKSSREYSAVVFFENRKPQGLENFTGLLYAIKNNKVTHFSHYKYWDDVITKRTVHPLALKESRGRWYLVAVDTKDSTLKTFGLDRIDQLDINKTAFKNTYTYNLEEIFRYSFGVINDFAAVPETVILSFTYHEGQYIKTYPLHNTQKVVEEKNRVVVELFVSITYDLVMELLSFGETLTVLEPVTLIETMKERFGNALRNY